MKNFLLAFALTSALIALAFSAPASAQSSPTSMRTVQLTPAAVNEVGSGARPGRETWRAVGRPGYVRSRTFLFGRD
ncbi:MAG: hypothetical protein ABI831_17725 [Betaproteobacteria bacterium]